MAIFSIETWLLTKLRIVELLQAPYYNPDMIWMVTPLIVTMIIMQFYFGKYSEEDLGWNGAVGNTLVLFFIAIDLLRHIYNLAPQDTLNFIIYPIQTTAALLVGFEAIALFFADFFRFLPKKLAFFISSPLPVNITAYVAMCIVYTSIPANRYTLFAALTLFAVLFIAIHILHFIIQFAWKAKN